MADPADTRTKIEGNLFAEIGPGGSLMFSSGYIKGVGDDEVMHTELIISPEGIKELVALLVRDAQLRIGADDAGQPCPCCNGSGLFPPEDNTPVKCLACNGTGQI